MNTAHDSNHHRFSWPTMVAALAACLVFAVLTWQIGKYALLGPAVDQARQTERARIHAEMTAADTEALNNVGWIDQTKGLVRLPIAEALKLAEREWQNPAQARSNLIVRVEKANDSPSTIPAKPRAFD